MYVKVLGGNFQKNINATWVQVLSNKLCIIQQTFNILKKMKNKVGDRINLAVLYIDICFLCKAGKSTWNMKFYDNNFELFG